MLDANYRLCQQVQVVGLCATSLLPHCGHDRLGSTDSSLDLSPQRRAHRRNICAHAREQPASSVPPPAASRFPLVRSGLEPTPKMCEAGRQATVAHVGGVRTLTTSSVHCSCCCICFSAACRPFSSHGAAASGTQRPSRQAWGLVSGCELW